MFMLTYIILIDSGLFKQTVDPLLVLRAQGKSLTCIADNNQHDELENGTNL
jgi:hypothetical protein